ncbi:hypothetical protein BJ170DRAFT_210780 [Xylariales sp. AK1849]|nr:hypothetical protein BJ170DRAFT_210780 [Xylariales sp. AK1849]
MSGPRLTAPAAKLARSISTTTAPTAVPNATTLITSSRAAAPLSHKYADLLKERNQDGDHSRRLTTRSANRPHPQPRRMRLMQTFTSTATRGARADPGATHLALLPSLESLEAPEADPFSRLRVPLLPDNFLAQHAPEAVDEPLPMPEISVIAANPETVAVSALTEVEGLGVDGVELKFAHGKSAQEPEPGMLRDLWKGLIDDVLGGGQNKGKFSM